MRKPRVMQLALSLSPGGTERLVIEICKHLSERIDFVVCCLDTPGAWAPELESRNIPVIALGRRPGFQPSLAAAIARLFRAHRIDTIHCHHYSPYVYGSLAKLLAPAHVVFTEHGRISERPLPKRRLVNPLFALLPGPICAVSAHLKRHMVAEGFPARRIRVVYNGIDCGSLPSLEQRAAAREALGIPRDAFVVGTAGRLNPVKNLPLMLQAQQALRTVLEGSIAVIVGEGPEDVELLRQADELGLAGSVIFTGYRADVRNLVPAFDVYLNCSKYEGVSLAILEAMAAGLPIVATRVGGNPEVVVDGETGYLVESSPSAIADVLTQLALDARLRRAMGDAARRRVIHNFSITRMVDEYAALYLGDTRSATSEAPMTVPPAADPISMTDPTRFVV